MIAGMMVTYASAPKMLSVGPLAPVERFAKAMERLHAGHALAPSGTGAPQEEQKAIVSPQAKGVILLNLRQRPTCSYRLRPFRQISNEGKLKHFTLPGLNQRYYPDCSAAQTYDQNAQ